jgi:hypothetical protein
MRLIWEFHRRAVAAAAVAAIVVAAVGSALGGPRRQAATTPPPPRHPAVATSTTRPAPLGRPVANNTAASDGPLRVTPLQTQTQEQVDSELAGSESPGSIAQAESETMPAPAVSAGYPAILVSAEGDPNAYALAFATELLDINYRSQTRTSLLGWAEYEEAPDTLPGVPARIADKSLVGSLAYAGVAGAEASPVPPAGQWAAPDSGVVQQVSGLAAMVAPDWTQLVTGGWEPVDPLMTIMAVTGTITVTVDGKPGPARSFSMAVILGGARHHPGYGAVAVSAWTEA